MRRPACITHWLQNLRYRIGGSPTPLTHPRSHLALCVAFIAYACLAQAGTCAGHIGRSDVAHEAVPTEVMMKNIIEIHQPEYPDQARQAGVEGTVALRLNVDPEGCPVGAIVISGPPALTQAALGAVFQWRFRPTVVNGTAMWVYAVVPVRFSLRENEATTPDVGRTLIRLKSGRIIVADSVQEQGEKVEYTRDDNTFEIPRSVVLEITRPNAASPPPGSPLPNAIVTTPKSAAPPPASLVGDWPPYETTYNIRKNCVPEAAGLGLDDMSLGARSCAIWNLQMGAEYDALVERGIELRRKICAAGKVTVFNLHDQMQLLNEWGSVRGEIIRRQSVDRFDRVRSNRMIADYNRMSVACPK